MGDTAGLSVIGRLCLKKTRAKKLGVGCTAMVPAFGKQREEDCLKLESSLHRLSLKNKTNNNQRLEE